MLPRPPCLGIPEEEFLARTGQRQKGARRTAPPKQRRVRHRGDVISVLARTVRELEAAVQARPRDACRAHEVPGLRPAAAGRAGPRPGVGGDSHQAEQLKRLDGIAAILAATAVRDTGLMALLAEDAGVSDAARALKRELERDLGIEPAPEEPAPAETAAAPAGTQPRVVPQSVISRQLANPFLAPDFSAAPQRTARRAAWRAGSCSARCSAPSSGPPTEPRRA